MKTTRRMERKMITVDRLKELVVYEPDTGLMRWRVDRPGSKKIKAGDIAGGINGSHGYWMIGLDGKRYLTHRLIWLYVHGKLPDNKIDHINGNRADNRIENLRDISDAGNAQNIHKLRTANRSGYLGVYFHNQRKRWASQIQYGETRVNVGLFDTPQEASKAYLEAKRKFHPAFRHDL